MTLLTAFGWFATISMVIAYWLETKNCWFYLVFAGTCVLSSIYAVLIHSWPLAVAEMIWALIAVWKWQHHYFKRHAHHE
jgi:hypothetical protein